MELNGKEIKFRRTVGAQIAVAEICPDRDPNRLQEVLSGDYANGQRAAMDFILALHDANEMVESIRDPEHEEVPLTREELLCMDDEAFTALFVEAYTAWAGSVPTMATKPTSKKKQGKK